MIINSKFQLSDAPVIIPQKPVGILGVGCFLPSKQIANDCFTNTKLTDEESSFISNTSGIKYRHYSDQMNFTDLAIQAARNALNDSGIPAEEIDLVIATHTSRDMNQLTPPNCITIQSAIGAKNATSLNIDAGFSGWIYSITVAASFICSGFYKKVLVTSGETLLTHTESTTMKSLLVGDGAGAFILGPTQPEYGFQGFHLMSGFHEGIAAEVKIKGGYAGPKDKNYSIKPFFSIAPDSFENDLPYVENLIPYTITKLLRKLEIRPDNIHKFIFAQKFLGLNQKWAKNLNVDYSKVHDTLEQTACIETASIPVITTDAYKKKLLKKGDLVVLSDMGSRWNAGSTILRWSI